jgi:hypothetical protein
MNMRDYFAAKALQGWLSTFTEDGAHEYIHADRLAEFCYRMADEMLKARLK